MPVLERVEAGPEAHLIVPGRVVGVRPPGQVQKAGQGLEMVPYAREDELELLVVAGAPESHALHALIDGHDIVLPTDGAGGGPVAHSVQSSAPTGGAKEPVGENLMEPARCRPGRRHAPEKAASA